MENKLVELYNKRHSCRKFNGQPIEYEKIVDLIQKARLAPSACNSQPWRVIITNDQQSNEKVRSALQDNNMNKFLDNASAFVLILDAPATLKVGSESKFTRDKFVKYDVGQFVAYLTLYAQSENISNIVIGWINNDVLTKNFNIEGYNCNLVVALGYSSESEIAPKKRLDVNDIII